ncbi:MAG: helix-turn-helix transcriptional regulator [Enterococcus thailandicus]|nr:helix-turn-helix transcriptional regulator [Enterococcus thailandicus]
MPGSRLRELREKTGMSQYAISKLAGVSQSAINRYENDQTEATYSVLVWFADYYDVSLDYLLGRTDKPQGALYACKTIEKKEMEQFVEACFDPTSPIGKRIKEQLVEQWTEHSKND